MKKTWLPGNHHILPKEIQKGNFSTIVNETTIPLTGPEHVQIHRDIREVGPFGALGRLAMRRATDHK